MIDMKINKILKCLLNKTSQIYKPGLKTFFGLRCFTYDSNLCLPDFQTQFYPLKTQIVAPFSKANIVFIVKNELNSI